MKLIKSNLLNITLVICLLLLSFLWGYLASYKNIFPNNIIMPDKYESKYKDYELVKLDQKWVKKLAEGGYFIHIRHAQREKWTDVTAFDAWELSNNIQAESSSFDKAVCLTDQGDEEAKLIGNIFEMANVKISRVISSPSCRARETAIIAFGQVDQISNSLLHRTAMTPEQHLPMTLKLREIIDKAKLVPGENILLSGHGATLSNNIEYLIDINNVGELDDRDETGFIILRRDGDKVIAEHKFKSIWHMANAFVEFEVN